MSGSDLSGSSHSGASAAARASGLHFVTSSAQHLPQGPLVAGTYSLYRQLKAQGYEVYRPHSLIEAYHDLSILTQTANTLERLTQSWLADFRENSVSAYLLYMATRSLFIYYSAEQMRQAGVAILAQPDLPKSTTPAPPPSSVESPGDRAIWASRWFGGYDLSLSTPSGWKLTTGASRKALNLWLTADYPTKQPRYIERLAWIMGMKSGRLRLAQPLIQAQSPVEIWARLGLEPGLEVLLNEMLNQQRQRYEQLRTSAQLALSRLKRLPARAVFNGMDGRQASMADALAGYDCPRLMLSQGAMVPHGGGVRQQVAELLSCIAFNSGPAVSQIAPRSPLQVPDDSKALLVPINRTVPAATQKTAAPFSLYFAPSIQRWDKAFHGLSLTCFEARDLAEALARSLRDMDDIRLYIRIMRSAKDEAKSPEKVMVSAGIRPEDLSDLYEPTQGIYDASLGSHSAYLEQADLVVSGGLSAVVFDALERRIPLLLLLPHAERVPALPAASVTELFSDTVPPQPVYSASIEDDLGKVIRRIRDKHQNHTLTDAALAPYIWT
jgi:hypothetical protein